MFAKLDFESFKKLASKHKRVIVHQEIPGDEVTPISVFHALQDSIQAPTLLESSPKEKAAGRYSFGT